MKVPAIPEGREIRPLKGTNDTQRDRNKERKDRDRKIDRERNREGCTDKQTETE